MQTARAPAPMSLMDAPDGITASIPRLADLVADDWTQEGLPPMPPMPAAAREIFMAASSSSKGIKGGDDGVAASAGAGELTGPSHAVTRAHGMVHQGSSDSIVSSSSGMGANNPLDRQDLQVPGTAPPQQEAAAPISVSDFLYLAEVRFLDEESNRRNTSFGGMEDTGTTGVPTTMEQCLTLMCLLEPEASTLEFGCEQLRETIAEKKRTLATMEDVLSSVNPPIFRQLQVATGDELSDMQAALRNLKLQCKLVTKSDWLLWRSKLEHTTRARLDENRRLLAEDKDAIGRNVGLVRDTAAMLRAATGKAQERLAARRATVANLQGSVGRLRSDIDAATAKEVDARQRLEDQRVRAGILAEREQSLLEEKARLQAAIAETRRSCEQAGGGHAAAGPVPGPIDLSQRGSPAIAAAEADAARALDDLEMLSAVQGLQLVPAPAARPHAYSAGCGFIAASSCREEGRESMSSGSSGPSSVVELVLRCPLPCLSIRISVGNAVVPSNASEEDAAPAHVSAKMLLAPWGEGQHKGISDQLPIILDTLQVNPGRAAELTAAFAPGKESSVPPPTVIDEWFAGDVTTVRLHIQTAVLSAESARLLLQDVADARRSFPLLAASQYCPRTAGCGGALTLTFIDFHSESKLRITLGLEQWSHDETRSRVVLAQPGYPFSRFSCQAEIIYRGLLAASTAGQDEMAFLGHPHEETGRLRPSWWEGKEWFTEEAIVNIVEQTAPGFGYLPRICSRLSTFMTHDSFIGSDT
eukprot:jgi/Mesvir1/29220/Mv20414-RA.1